MARAASPSASLSMVTNRLPMIAPDEAPQAASNVALLEMPKPTSRGCFSPRLSMRRK